MKTIMYSSYWARNVSKLLIAAKANNALHDREQKFLLDATTVSLKII